MTRSAFAPYKPRLPGTLKACVAQLYAQVGGVQVVMIRLGRSKATVTAYSDAESDSDISFAQVAALTGPETMAAAEYLAALAGGVFMPVSCSADDAQALTAESVREHGEAMGLLVAALASDGIDAVEAAKALPEIDDALRALCGLRSLVVGVLEKKRSG